MWFCGQVIRLYVLVLLFIAVCKIGSRLDAKATKHQRVTYFFSPGAILGDRMFTCVHVCCSAIYCIYNDLSLADSASSVQAQCKKAKPASHKHARGRLSCVRKALVPDLRPRMRVR